MGDMSGGLSGLFGGSSPPADPTGGLGMGGFDPTGGGGFADPMMSGDPTGGMGGDPSALGIASPTAQMQQAMGGTQALTQPPITDQPSAPTPASGQAPPAPPPPPQLDKAQALFGGPSTHPDWGFGYQPTQGPSATPGPSEPTMPQDHTAPWAWSGQSFPDAVAARGLGLSTLAGGTMTPGTPSGAPIQPNAAPDYGPPPPIQPIPPLRSGTIPQTPSPTLTPDDLKGEQYAANASGGIPDVTPQDAGYPGLDPKTNLAGDPNATFNERFGGTDPNATFNERFPSGVPPRATASQGPMLATGAIPDNLKTTPALTPDVTRQPGTAGGGGTTPGATSQVTPPGTSAPAGQAPQSPLEQLVSGFMHMLFGQGMGPLQQLIARFLGVNPHQLFPQFYGGGFNRPTGPGYFPPGTTGGRNIQGGPPRLQGAPNPNAPRAPTIPGGPQTAVPPPSRRNKFDSTLPEPPYTVQSRNQPPPWYTANQGARRALAPIQHGQVQSTVGSTLRAAGASNNAIAGIMANIKEESAWNPGLRHPDQPHFSGEAHYAHGLYQEGGDNWNRYARWLNGRDWRDPQLQTQFLAENLRQNYPRTWAHMNAAQTPTQAAQIFNDEYLRPATQYRLKRDLEFRQRGVPIYESAD